MKESLDEWQATGKVRRMWSGDPSVWTGQDEGKWIGWLTITEDQIGHAEHLAQIADEIRTGGFTHALLLGMGGSSLCVEVMAKTFGSRAWLTRNAGARLYRPCANQSH